LGNLLGRGQNDIAKYYKCKSKSGASNAVNKIKNDLICDSILARHVKNIGIVLKKSAPK
jgi:hypothetical protein